MTRMILSATLVLGLTACGKGEGEKKTEPAAEPATPAPTAPTDTPPAEPAAGTEPAAAADGDAGATAAGEAGGQAGSEAPPPEAAAAEPVPTTEDFEDKAAKEVDQKNLESEVSKMEKELGIEAPKK